MTARRRCTAAIVRGVGIAALGALLVADAHGQVQARDSLRRAAVLTRAWPVAPVAGIQDVRQPQLPVIDTARAQDAQPLSPTFDTLSRKLDSREMNERWEAVVRLEPFRPADIPPSVRAKLVSLLNAEAMADTLSSDEALEHEEETSNERGEYLADLSNLVLKLNDRRALPGIAIVGVQSSRAAQEFVTRQGGEGLPYLEIAARRKPAARPMAVHTMARVLGESRQLAPRDSTRIMMHIYSTAETNPVVFSAAVRTARMADAQPLVERIARESPDAVTRTSAQTSVTQLRTFRLQLSVPQQARQLQQTLETACESLGAARQPECGVPRRLLASVVQAADRQDHAGAARSLDAFARYLGEAGGGVRTFTGDQRLVLNDGARALRSRL